MTTRIMTLDNCAECPFSSRSRYRYARAPELEIRCLATGKTIGCRRVHETVPIPAWCPLVEADETFDGRVVAVTDEARKEAQRGQS